MHNVPKYKPGRHAKAGASSAYKWMQCAGSLAMEAAFGKPDTGSQHAAVGTFQHHVAAAALAQHKNAKDFLGYKERVDGFDFVFDEEMAECVQTYLDAVWQAVGLDGELYIEQELDISWLTGEPDAVGTADAIVVTPNGQLIVIDLKTGRNRVDAYRNRQLIIYAMAAKKAYEEGKLQKSTPPVEDAGDDLI